MTVNTHFLNNYRLKVAFHVGVWLVLILVYAWLFQPLYGDLGMSILRGLGNLLPMALLFYANLWLVEHYFEKNRYAQFLLWATVLMVGIAALRVNLNQFFPEIKPNSVILSPGNKWWAGAVLTNILTLLVSTFYQILEIRFRHEQQNAAIISKQNEAQLQFLRAQINPHFLFNTLNNIYSLAVVRSPQTADMVMQLSKLLRYVVYDSKAEQIPLETEVDHIEQYLQLFRMRSEAPLDITFQVSGAIEGLRLEPMMLIPLVENCCKHADFNTNEKAYIRLDLRVENGWLHFHTTNTKNDQDRQKDQVGGVGMDNLRQRLELLYPNAHRFTTQDKIAVFEVGFSIKTDFSVLGF
ncbi:MAG TPA: histidine kinase [Haliscomenobacter sp.]|uniref:sensor histidine kinase n=1 Tax=Haliscomenobacter sp. TaxID=2717303 RepID=UPI002C257570|nr:histidine kinase [Haliscomenobacter sp.]HOY19790.1 histidine kinase [Haliscomenobacter sp.]